MRIVGIAILLMLATASAVAAQVRGRIIDLHTGDGISGATVRAISEAADREVFTDSDGAYSLKGLAAAEYWLVVRHPGYDPATVRVVVHAGSDLMIDLPLEVRPIAVTRLVVPVSRAQPATAPATAEDSLLAAVEGRQNGVLRTAATAALNDLMSVTQEPPTDPGHAPNSLHIWGSNAERGRVMLDGAVINAPLHLGAILAPVDPGILASADLHTGGAPARYDGGTNYVVEYVTRKAHPERLRSWGELGLLASRIGVEAPVTDDGSVMVAGRRVNDEAVDAVIDQSFAYEYRDGLARTAWQIGEDGALDALVVSTRETIRIPRDQTQDVAAWRNFASVLSWDANERGSGARARASFSRGIVDLPLLSAPDGHLTATLDRSAVTAAHDWTFGTLDLDAGVELEHIRLARHSQASADPSTPEKVGPVSCTLALPCASATATTAAAFTDFAWRPGARFAINAGLRAAVHTDASRLHLLPRLALTWLGSGSTTATLSAGRYSQIAVLEPLHTPEAFAFNELLTATEHATQYELTLAHRSPSLAVQARAFLRHAPAPGTSADYETVPGAELAWALVLDRNSIWGGYSMLARQASPFDSTAGHQHLAFIGVGTGAGPLHLDLSGVYGAGVPLTSIVLDRPPVMTFAGEAPAAEVPRHGQGPYMRVDAVLSGEWDIRLHDRDVHLMPYAKLINAFSRRGAMFYYREGSTAELQPLSALPTLPVLGVRWVF